MTVCGRGIVLEEIQGSASRIELCTRRDGPCPWLTPAGTVAGLGAWDEHVCAAALESEPPTLTLITDPDMEDPPNAR